MKDVRFPRRNHGESTGEMNNVVFFFLHHRRCSWTIEWRLGSDGAGGKGEEGIESRAERAGVRDYRIAMGAMKQCQGGAEGDGQLTGSTGRDGLKANSLTKGPRIRSVQLSLLIGQ